MYKAGGLKISGKSDMEEKIYGKVFIATQNQTFTLTEYNTHFDPSQIMASIKKTFFKKEDTKGH